MKKIKLKSPAKINLTLEVVKKLPNGFHELRSVMFKLSNLFDELEVVFDEKKGDIKIFCDDNNVPTDEKNIVWKIAQEFFKKTGKKVGLQIKIKKRIPLAAGLGGGSSNGASVLLALNDYFGKPLRFRELIEVAAEVGKDIPVFLSKEKMVYVAGMGEKVKAIKESFNGYILLAKTKGYIETPWAYDQLDKSLVFMDDIKRENLSQKFIKINKNRGVFFYNDFEIVAQQKYPEIENIKKALISFGAIDASMTGKGPTVFGIFKTKKEALKVRGVLKKYYPKLFIELG